MSIFEICLAVGLLVAVVTLGHRISALERKPDPVAKPQWTVQREPIETPDYSVLLRGIQRAILETGRAKGSSEARERALEMSFRVNRAAAALAVVEPVPPVC